MADEIRDVVIRLAVEQSKNKIEVDATEAKKEVEEFGEYFSTVADDVTAGLDDIQEGVDDLAAKADGLDNLNDGLRETTDASFSAGEGFKAAGSGALTLVRGAALLGFSAESDLGKFLEKLAKIQGAFDVLQGSFDTIKGVTEGLRGMRVAAQNLALAQTAAATANTGLAASLGVLNVAAAPLIGIGGMIAAIGVGYLLLKDDGDDLNATLDDTIERLGLIRDESNKTIETYEAISRSLRDPTQALSELNEELKTESDRGGDLQKRLSHAQRAIPEALPGWLQTVGPASDRAALERFREKEGFEPDYENKLDQANKRIAGVSEKILESAKREFEILKEQQTQNDRISRERESALRETKQGDALEKALLKKEEADKRLTDSIVDLQAQAVKRIIAAEQEANKWRQRLILSDPTK